MANKHIRIENPSKALLKFLRGESERKAKLREKLLKNYKEGNDKKNLEI